MRRKVVPAEIVDTIDGVADRCRLCPSDTAKYCFEKYPRTCIAHPYCFSLRWRGIRLFYYTIFVANLEKFCLFFPPSFFFILFPLFRPLPRFCDFDHISYIITLLISDSSEVRRFRSYDFYPVNNVDFSMMSSRLWTRIGNLPRSTENLRIWLSYLRNIWSARPILYLSTYDFVSACIFCSISTRKRISYKL